MRYMIPPLSPFRCSVIGESALSRDFHVSRLRCGGETEASVRTAALRLPRAGPALASALMPAALAWGVGFFTAGISAPTAFLFKVLNFFFSTFNLASRASLTSRLISLFVWTPFTPEMAARRRPRPRERRRPGNTHGRQDGTCRVCFMRMVPVARTVFTARVFCRPGRQAMID